MILLKIIENLEDEYKRTFGLGTQYAGYLKSDIILSFLTIKRIYDTELLNGFESLTIFKFNEKAESLGLKRISENMNPLFPNFLRVLNAYDLSEKTVSEKDWTDFTDYLKKRDLNE